jgi:hypothetical protein
MRFRWARFALFTLVLDREFGMRVPHLHLTSPGGRGREHLASG